jgi:hypothetical protein
MHANDHGLGGKHFFPQLKEFVSELGGDARQRVDDQYVIPWSIRLGQYNTPFLQNEGASAMGRLED